MRPGQLYENPILGNLEGDPLRQEPGFPTRLAPLFRIVAVLKRPITSTRSPGIHIYREAKFSLSGNFYFNHPLIQHKIGKKSEV